ncbi:MAG: type IX secretion system membrane protein PorP/SprF [Ferruginibacter sp.]|nr:type IX secretion system membrane protein PorP/SprF [Cytophagales bacterium]
MKKIYVLLWALLLLVKTARAQDPQYSQFYAAPLYLNPAFAGTTDDSRVMFNHRIQWPKLDAVFTTSGFGVDHNFERYNSGVGLLVTNDQISASGLKSLDLGAQYSYNLKLSQKTAFRAGFQLSYVNRSIDYSRFVFNDQLSEWGPNGRLTTEVFDASAVSFADISSGGLFYGERWWFGFAAHHVNRPGQSFMKGESRLPMKGSLHTGYKFYIDKLSRTKDIEKEREKSVTLCANYKAQGEFDQLEVGMYTNYNVFVLGGWYRGLPIKPYKQGLSNHESIVVLTGFRYKGLNMGYSHDLTISQLAGATGGAHEISIAYDFPLGKQGKKKVAGRIRRLPCPQF